MSATVLRLFVGLFLLALQFFQLLDEHIRIGRSRRSLDDIGFTGPLSEIDQLAALTAKRSPGTVDVVFVFPATGRALYLHRLAASKPASADAGAIAASSFLYSVKKLLRFSTNRSFLSEIGDWLSVAPHHVAIATPCAPRCCKRSSSSGRPKT